MSTQCLSTVPNKHEQALSDGIGAGSPFLGGALYTSPTTIAHPRLGANGIAHQSASANGYPRLGGNTIAYLHTSTYSLPQGQCFSHILTNRITSPHPHSDYDSYSCFHFGKSIPHRSPG